MIALVDADSLLYKVGFAIEERVIWNEMEVLAGLELEKDESYYTDIKQCYRTFDQLMSNVTCATDCDASFLIFSGTDNFRLSLPTSYKENRKDFRKPTGYREILDYAIETYNTKTVNGIEADDYVVWLKMSAPEDYIVCAIDKDVLYQTEGTHYNYHTGEEVEVREKDAIRFAYFQTLVGDSSDGYKGCPGIGAVKAGKLLDGLKTEREMWEAVVAAYEKKGLTEEDALWIMRLANMRQFDGTKVNYWEAPKPVNNQQVT
tara:strand:+ start:6754 stop:7533 length:780 start_codon:yes stop_codon:yes gene_type:complete